MRQGITLVELLVVLAIVAILAAILFPVLARARERGRYATCLSHQHQLALAVTMYAQDYNERYPDAATVWQRLPVERGILRCPQVDKALPLAYVYNNALSGMPTAHVERPAEMIITADGRHNGSTTNGTVDQVAYQLRDLEKRHQGKCLASYVDGHVESNGPIWYLSGLPGHPDLPNWRDVAYWLAADVNAFYDTTSTRMTVWGDGSWLGMDAVPLDVAHAPTFIPAVPTLNGKPAVYFRPPVSHPNILVSPDIGLAWYGEEGTAFIVFQPDGNNAQYEYTVIDQSTGDPDQGTRLRFERTAGAAAVAYAGGNGGGGGKGGGGGGTPDPVSVTLSASSTALIAGDEVTLTWQAANARRVESSNFGTQQVSGTKTLRPDATTTYSITVRGDGGLATATVLVTVDPGEDNFAGHVSLFRRTATVNYPPDDIAYNRATYWTFIASPDAYRIFRDGLAWGNYAGGPDWKAPGQIYLGGSPHGTTANRRSFDGYIAEVIIYRVALSDTDRQKVERYLATKYGLSHSQHEG